MSLRGAASSTSRVTLRINRASGNPQIGDIITVVPPPGTELTSIQGYIDKGSGPVTISGFTSSTYTLTSSEIPPASTTWPITVKAQILDLYTDNLNLTSGALVLPVNAKLALEGDSITAGTGSTSSSLAFADMLATAGRYRQPLNFNQAVSGENTGQMVTTTELNAVNALGADVVEVMAGTNDIRLTALTPTQIRDNLATMAASYIANGTSYVVINQVLPCNDSEWNKLTPTRQADLAILNDLIAGMASTKIKIVPVPATFNIAVHCLADQIHLSDAGAALVAANRATVMNTLIDQGSADIRTLYLDSSNLLVAASANPQLTGTSGSLAGGVTGQVATGWGANAALDGTMAVVASKVANFNGAEGQQFTISGTPATTGRSLSFSRTISFSGQIGETFEAWIDFQMDAGNTGVNMPALLMSISGETGAESPGRTNTVTRTSGTAVAGVIRTYLTGALSNTRTSFVFNFVTTFGTGPTNAVITVGRPFARKVV